MPEYYYYGLAALMYLTTCWIFTAVRWCHTCRAPKERQQYIWPDRKLQCLVYLCASVLLPYALDYARRMWVSRERPMLVQLFLNKYGIEVNVHNMNSGYFNCEKIG